MCVCERERKRVALDGFGGFGVLFVCLFVCLFVIDRCKQVCCTKSTYLAEKGKVVS